MAPGPTSTITTAPSWPFPAPEYQAGRTEVAAYMVSAGWTHADIVTGLAIAEAESSLNIAAVSGLAFDGSRGYGVWQIEYPTHKALFDALPNPGIENGDWISIHANAVMALQIKQSQGWHAWSTYTSGAYFAFLPGAQAALQAVDLIAASMGPAATAKHPGLDNPVAAAVVTPKTTAQEVALTLQWRTGALVGGLAQTSTGAIAGVSSDAGAALLPSFKAAAPFASALDFLNKLGDPQTWVRIVEVAIGAVLVVVALNTFAKPVTQPIIQAGKGLAK